MMTLPPSRLIAALGRAVLFVRRLAWLWRATRGFDYAAFYRWYWRQEPARFVRDLVVVLGLVLNPVNWIAALRRKS